MVGVRKQPGGMILRLHDIDADHGFDFLVVRDRVDRAFRGFQHLDLHLHAIGQQRAAPAPGPEGRDRRQRQERRLERQDRPMRREVIGGGARRRRQKQPVADQFGDPLAIVHAYLQLGGLVGLAEHRHFVDRELGARVAVLVDGDHLQRMDRIIDRMRDALDQVLGRIFVHQEADRAPVHAVDELAGIHGRMQHLQHEAVAAERHDHVRLLGRHVFVAHRQVPERDLRLVGGGGGKRDGAELAWHGTRSSGCGG